MVEYLMKEKKVEIFNEFGGFEKNIGFIEVQVVLFIYWIKEFFKYLNDNLKDYFFCCVLLMLVGKCKCLLGYLVKKNLDGYCVFIEKLNICK